MYLQHITKTRLYNFDPLKSHFCIVKLGFTGVYIISLILLVLSRNRKPENFHFFGGEIFNIFEKACFRNDLTLRFK